MLEGMPLDDGLLNTTVSIIGDDPPRGTNRVRRPIGTGFFLTVRNDRDPSVRHGYLITAAHVVAPQHFPVEVLARNPQGGLHPLFSVPVKQWHYIDGLDIAV